MIMDEKLIFSDAQAETTVAEHDSTNVIDQGAGTDAFGNALIADAGSGGDIWLNVVVIEAVVGTSSTVQFKLEHSTDNATFADSILVTAAIAEATLVAGYTVIKAPLPSGLNRYLKMTYTIGTAVLTAGKFTAYLSMQPDIG
jgi:hypothetical protein